jgi:uncharacterized protein YggU (UPF0235/DUF167 family)
MMPGPEAQSPISDHPRGSTLALVVAPRSSQNRLERQGDGQLRARIAAAPVDGAANAMLRKMLADALDFPRSRISILSGESGRQKRLLFEGVSQSELNRRLLEHLRAQRA